MLWCKELHLIDDCVDEGGLARASAANDENILAGEYGLA